MPLPVNIREEVLFEYKTAQNVGWAVYPDNPNNAYSYHIFSAALVDEYDGPFYPHHANNADGRYLGYSVRLCKKNKNHQRKTR